MTNLNKFSKDQIAKEYFKYLLENSVADSLEHFTAFLQSKELSTNHAKDVYNFIVNNNNLPEISEFKLRKDNRKTNAFIKKFLIPVAISGAVAAIVMASLASIIAGGATSFLGMAITSDVIANTINFAGAGFAYGVAGSAGFIVGKNALTKFYYNKRYGATKSLKQLNEGIKLENTNLADLVETISKTNEKIYSLREGKKITKPFRFIGRHFLNIINRNRIHSVEATTKELLTKFYAKLADKEPTDTEKFNDAEMKKIVELLTYINNFAASDITASKLYTLLNCNEEKKHSHKIEALDIWSKLEIFIENADATQNVSKKTHETAKSNSKNLKTVYDKANTLLNENANLLQACIARYNALNPNSETVIANPVVVEDPITTVDPVVEDPVVIDTTISDDNNDTDVVTPIVDDISDDTVVTPIVDDANANNSNDNDNNIDDTTVVDDSNDTIVPVADNNDTIVDNDTNNNKSDDTVVDNNNDTSVIDDNNKSNIVDDTTVDNNTDDTVVPVSDDQIPDNSSSNNQDDTNLIVKTTKRLQARVKVDELARGNKVTITNLQNNSKETIKVTATPSGTKINVVVTKADGTLYTASHRNSNSDVNEEIKKILQETALGSGVDLEQLHLL
ncbi:MAG: hypothetical protein IJD48_00355 [Clostridia bacterium]|nr:hypothetical protein [Clostridia bacterium]